MEFFLIFYFYRPFFILPKSALLSTLLKVYIKVTTEIFFIRPLRIDVISVIKSST